MKKVRLSAKDIETLIWTIERHMDIIHNKLRTEEDLAAYRVFNDYKIYLDDLIGRLLK